MKKIAILFTLILSINSILFSQSWREIKTVEDVCKAYPDEIKSMLDQFNLDYQGMEKVKQAYETGKVVDACKYLLEYYKNGNTAGFLRIEQPEKTEKTDAQADTILKNVFVVQNVRGEVPFGEDGHRDWYYKGPNNDEEWAWLSNRHSQINEVFSVYLETGNPKYPEYIDLFLRDFIIKSMPYPGVKSSTSVWRGLEVAARVKVWSRIFYGLINSGYLSPSTQLLMLSSIPDHAHYNRNFHAGNNWLTMEISALATAATNFPEYKKSPEWLDYAVETISESMKGQVYPDGVQTELTSHYHNVAMANFQLFKDICDRSNTPLPDFFNRTIESMYSYIAHAVRPDGNRILNNDGDKGSDVELILKGAEIYGKPEWEYIATNGKSGVKPTDGPSYFYPYAGQLISRSGFDNDAQWSFFDIGPWGSGHQHNDKLHISISAYGRDFLVDGGRFAYRGEVARKFRGYARGTQSHNDILIDGKGQAPGPSLAKNPVPEKNIKITDTYDYASGSFDSYIDLDGQAKHSRNLFYVRGSFWVVVDQIETDKPREIQTLWHWHPQCKVEKGDNGIVSTKNEAGNLEIIPVGDTDWKIDFIKGQEEPEIQGWYSEEYNKYEPNIASIYSTNIEENSTFVWLLMPSENEPHPVEAKILSKTDEIIKLSVNDSRYGDWVIDVPLSDSKKANLSFSAKGLKYSEELIQLHQNVWNNILGQGFDEGEVGKLLADINDKGEWSGINYASKTRGSWSPRDHLGNLLDITIAYQTPGSKYYHKKEVSEKIHRALNYWLENDFTSPNWWHPEIGTPMMVAPVMVLMEEELTKAQKDLGFKILKRSKTGMTGQNKVWLSGNVLLRSLLLRDTEKIIKASESIKKELVVSMSEGVQPDWSYHQHGPQLQFGNYGLSYVNDMIKWIAVLRGTPFKFDESKVSILRNYLLNGQQWVTWKDQLDISACGRQLFIDSPESKAKALSQHFSKMQKLDPAFAETYKAANNYNTLSGHKHFWRSDFQVWRNPKYYASVKMCSERVIGAESCNSENIQGYYMGDGATFLYQTGEEYRNIFPFLDWKKIPGTTTMQDDEPLPVLTARGYRIKSDFVGGVSDGKTGIAAMDYNRDGLKARKAWFMFDDKIVCLGSGISSDKGLEVTTGINQTYLNSKVLAKVKGNATNINGEIMLNSPSWVLHDNVGYIFPDGGNIQVQAKNVEGSWNWVTESYEEEIIHADLFRMWFNHGKNPGNETYVYILVPNADKKKLKSLEKNEAFKIYNKENIQAVISKDETLVGIVFYEPGKLEDVFGVEVDKPCIVMLKKTKEGLELSVSDPSQSESEIEVTINGNYSNEKASIEGNKTKIIFSLPKNEDAGKTVSLRLT